MCSNEAPMFPGHFHSYALSQCLTRKKKCARETKQSKHMELIQQAACCYIISGYKCQQTAKTVSLKKI